MSVVREFHVFVLWHVINVVHVIWCAYIVVYIPAGLVNKMMLITRYLFTLNLCTYIFESIFDCIGIRLPVFDLRHTLLAQNNTCPPAGIMFYRWCIKEYFEQQRLTLVSLQSRINLSPFTKDFRAGEHSMSL